jgi:amino acid adenylation domain-containing protein/thioester reductase-like protein
MRIKRPHDGFRSSGHRERYVHDLFDAQAARQPGRDAVVSGQARLTYRQLSQSANQLAHHLRALGVGPETLAGVCLERGTEAIRCLLAVLKAGGAYLPLDPALPAARLAQMCSQARPGVILAGRAEAAALPATGARLLVLEELAPVLAGHQVTAPVVRLHPDNAAYVICTSGSTGHPKAVAVSHGSLACVLAQLTREYRICARDRVLQLASLSFDTSVEQALVTLLGGATLMLPAAGTVAPADLLRYLVRQQITVVDLTPAYWHQLLAGTGAGDDRLLSVRLMITGGDLADRADCQAARQAAPVARLLNAYGLTETTITSALFDVGADISADAAAEPVPPTAAAAEPARVPVPAGTALRHAQLLVLDASLNPVPAGEEGEIYIGGCGIARGYLGRPDLTAQRFVPNPYSAEPGGRMYRTGDLGRWREDRNLEVIGRMDRQLKISGYRVEPAEIERALAGHPGVGEATVIARVTGSAKRQLVAYYTRRRGGDPGGSAGGLPPDLPSEASLRSFLAARVPGFMIPAAFIAVDQLPATPAGAPGPQAPAGAPGPQAPAGPVLTASGPQGGYSLMQAGVSHLWSELLKTGPVSLDDDFFALGGDSLLAAEMLARARVMFGISADHIRPLTRSLLRDPTLRGFAAAAQDARAGLLTAGRVASRADFTRDAELHHPISTGMGPPPEGQRPREILLTGATGFLGIHLLRALTTATTARVHCLVRAQDATHARRRIADTARRYEVDLDLALDRVVPVAGDLAAPALGLPPGVFSELARTIDVIHHAGALVNFIYPYEELRAANVTGTRELIRLAGLYRGIPVHYVSTTTVLAGFGAAGVRQVTESTPLAHADQLRMGYVETKFVAEELLRNAGRAGLPIAIYRPLDIGGDQRHGAWNTATEMCALIKFITDTGLAPDTDLPLDIVPVDICAAAISYISLHAGLSGRTYHLASPKHARLGLLVDRLRQHGFGIKEIAYEEWVDVLLENAARTPGHPMSHFVPLFVDRCEESGLTVAEMYLEHVFPSYTRTNTEQALRGSGIALPAVDSELLDLNIAHLMASGYLRAPDEAAGLADAGDLLSGLDVVQDLARCRRRTGRVRR